MLRGSLLRLLIGEVEYVGANYQVLVIRNHLLDRKGPVLNYGLRGLGAIHRLNETPVTWKLTFINNTSSSPLLKLSQ